MYVYVWSPFFKFPMRNDSEDISSMKSLNKSLIFFFWQVQQKRWKVETNSRLDSVLLLSAVNLPGGELVRCS